MYIFSVDAYSSKSVVYEWQSKDSVTFVPGMTLSQFDLMGSPQKNLTFERRNEEYSILQVSFNLQRNTGYFVIQVYVPCVLIVVLSWVSFWIHREATSDRVGLGKKSVNLDTHLFSAFRDYHRFDSFDHQFGFSDGFTKSSVCYCVGLVFAHELFLLHCYAVGVRWSALFY